MSKDEERYDVSQHDGITEGPWKIEGARRIEGKSDLRIVVKGGISREANLQFIASSPEILDALKKAYEKEDEVREYVRHLTSSPEVLGMLKDSPSQAYTIENLRLSLEGLLTILGADPKSGYGRHSSEVNVLLDHFDDGHFSNEEE